MKIKHFVLGPDSPEFSNHTLNELNRILKRISRTQSDMTPEDYNDIIASGTKFMCVGEFEGNEDPHAIVALVCFNLIKNPSGIFGQISHLAIDNDYQGDETGKNILAAVNRYANKLSCTRINYVGPSIDRYTRLLLLEYGYTPPGNMALLSYTFPYQELQNSPL